MGNTGQAELIAMPLIEIITHGSKFFDYKTKYFSKTVEEVCPAKISNKLTTDIQNKAKYVHELIGCDGLTRSDFILSSKNNEVYFLEINTIPGQTEASLCPKEAMAMGISFADFLEKQINLALEKYESKK
jgi:D-alanine-D-alanine ligase